MTEENTHELPNVVGADPNGEPVSHPGPAIRNTADAADELVALYDEHGRPSGVAPRSRMRAENLRHAATAVVVRNSAGQVYVHRRTPIKDVYPGRRDFAAGGVIGAGEDPDTAAARELAEELGITGVRPVPLLRGHYRDDHTDFHGFCYTLVWDGELRWQPEEVAGGEWMTPAGLLRELRARPDDFMPDTVSLLGDWLAVQAATDPTDSGSDGATRR